MAKSLKKIIFEEFNYGKKKSITETLWAQEIENNYYQVLNSPFFFYGISFNDIIEVKKNDNGMLCFVKVIKHSGHSTYRVSLLTIGKDEFAEEFKPIAEFGASYEEGVVFAIDVPPNGNIHKIYALLEKGEEKKLWEFEEGHCAHPVLSKN